jgi:sensor histidine kinase YesM
LTSAIVSIAVKSVQKNNRIEKEKKEIEKAHLESELNQLKQQLNPHFLFNTLNNIYSLIAKDQEKAQESVHMLSHMMRYVLYESRADFLPVSKEISFINNYINLMKLRLGSNVKLNISVEDCPGNFFIAPLVLITFAENAFKHSAGAFNDSFINIKIAFEDNKLIYSTINSIGREQNLKDKNSGVGLANLHKRLTLLYGDDYYLFTNKKDNVYYSDLEIKLRK